MTGATCHVCGEAFIPEAWQRDRGMLLCPKHLNRRTGDPRDEVSARRVRRQVLANDPPCHWCGGKATTIDHYPIPIIRGGPTEPWNVVPACERCNKSRGARPGPPRGLQGILSTQKSLNDSGTLTEEQVLKTLRDLKKLT